MKLYTFAPAANALRVEMFLREKELILETISICRYLDEQFNSSKLFGNDKEERAVIDMWNRRIELDGFLPLLHSVRNKTSFFKGKVVPGTRTSINQSPEIVERGIEMFDILLNRIEPHLSKNKFLLGDKFTIADITSHFMFNLSNMLKIDFGQKYKNVYRWKSDLEKRPSNPLLDNA